MADRSPGTIPRTNSVTVSRSHCYPNCRSTGVRRNSRSLLAGTRVVTFPVSINSLKRSRSSAMSYVDYFRTCSRSTRRADPQVDCTASKSYTPCRHPAVSNRTSRHCLHRNLPATAIQSGVRYIVDNLGVPFNTHADGTFRCPMRQTVVDHLHTLEMIHESRQVAELSPERIYLID